MHGLQEGALVLVTLISGCFWGMGAPSGDFVAPAPAPADTHPVCADSFVAELVSGTRHWSAAVLSTADYGTGTPLFDEEWLFGTWAMAAVGLGQHALLCPSGADDDIAAMELALGRMLSPEGLAFDATKYGSPLAERLADDHGSIAALGYGGLALALYRGVAPSPKPALLETEAAWMAAIARRLGPVLAETYPKERYPVDNAAAVGALALHDAIVGDDHGQVLEAARGAIRSSIDAESGLLFQSLTAAGKPAMPPRGSGTFFSAWFLHRADRELSRALYEAGKGKLSGEVLGIYAMREFLPGVEGFEDIDSGPLIMGFSVSSTGFALGSAVAHGDASIRDRLLSTVHLGTPMAMEMVKGLQTSEEGATGSALGDALMLAMLTAEGLPGGASAKH